MKLYFYIVTRLILTIDTHQIQKESVSIYNPSEKIWSDDS